MSKIGHVFICHTRSEANNVRRLIADKWPETVQIPAGPYKNQLMVIATVLGEDYGRTRIKYNPAWFENKK